MLVDHQLGVKKNTDILTSFPISSSSIVTVLVTGVLGGAGLARTFAVLSLSKFFHSSFFTLLAFPVFVFVVVVRVARIVRLERVPNNNINVLILM